MTQLEKDEICTYCMCYIQGVCILDNCLCIKEHNDNLKNDGPVSGGTPCDFDVNNPDRVTPL